MENYISILKELENEELPLTAKKISVWQWLHERDFKHAIENTICGKWQKWRNYEKIFPCVCSSREEDCIFLEAFAKLLDVYELNESEEKFKNIVLEFKRIANDEYEVKEWLKKYEETFLETNFDGRVIIYLNQETNEKIILKIDNDDFANVLEFIAIFEANYYKICDDYIDFDK